MGAASDFTERRFGGVLRVRERNVTVGLSQVSLLPNDPDRLQALITMLTGDVITLSYRSPVVSGEGVLLPGTGATFRSIVDDDGDVVAWELFAIADVAAQQVNVVEIVREFPTPEEV